MIDELESQKTKLNTTLNRITDLFYNETFGIAGKTYEKRKATNTEQSMWFISQCKKAKTEFNRTENKYSRYRNCLKKLSRYVGKRFYNKVK